MSIALKIILTLSLIFNILAIWGLFHYVMYGGSPLGELKRKVLGNPKSSNTSISIADENARIRQEAANSLIDSLRVVFLGASITRAWDLQKYFPEIHAINRGIGGFVPDLLIGFKANVIDLKPKAVVIKFCSINLRPGIQMESLKDALQMMIRLSRDNDIIPIVTTIIPSGKLGAHIGQYSVVDSLRSYNDWLRNYARQEKLFMIDYARAIGDENGFLPRDCSVDPVHLNNKGYDIITAAARPVIHEALRMD